MDIRQSFLTALRNLQANRVRAVQSLLGMIVGVAAVFAICGVGWGQIQKLHCSFRQYSSDLVYVNVYLRAESGLKLTEDDMRALLSENTDLYNAFSPLVYLEDNLRYGDKIYTETSALGVGEGFLASMPALTLSEGRFLQHMDIDRRQNVCVVGSYVANEVMGGNALGGTLKIRGENYTVVGVLAEAPVIDENWNIGAYIPYTNARQLAGEGFVSFNSGNYYRTDYYINASSAENVRPLREAVWENMRETYGDAQVTHTASLSRQQNEEEWSIMMSMVAPVAGAVIVLLVGCVGIINHMTAQINERTPEIGLRKAFGATNQDIRRQFMLESGCTCFFGGVLGILLGLPFCVVACRFANLSLQWVGVPLVPVLAAMLTAMGVGVISGTYPANQAAQLEPVEALCYN